MLKINKINFSLLTLDLQINFKSKIYLKSNLYKVMKTLTTLDVPSFREYFHIFQVMVSSKASLNSRILPR